MSKRGETELGGRYRNLVEIDTKKWADKKPETFQEHPVEIGEVEEGC